MRVYRRPRYQTTIPSVSWLLETQNKPNTPLMTMTITNLCLAIITDNPTILANSSADRHVFSSTCPREIQAKVMILWKQPVTKWHVLYLAWDRLSVCFGWAGWEVKSVLTTKLDVISLLEDQHSVLRPEGKPLINQSLNHGQCSTGQTSKNAFNLIAASWVTLH